ncbi:hypothetical protein CHUAL_004232 [Chamberlinius hualienensis]
MNGQFRFSVWDPILLISQMVTMQCCYYVCLGLWIVLASLLEANLQSPDNIFAYQELKVRETRGRLIIGAFVLNSLTCAFALWYVVKRTKQCLDFTVTVHIVHLLVCWILNKAFPTSLSWWLLCVVCNTLMCVCGEFLCMRTELKAIPISLGPKADV